MKGHDVLTPSRVESAIGAHGRKDVLRFITCGSVDDGKSTLIGRLLHDTKQIFEDQMNALQRDSRRYGTQGSDLDLALLVDGLAAEREQGITIDVAYRFFATSRRSFIVADTPGHEQYTSNMATGASTADVAVLLVDARRGLSRQTRRHALIASMLGISRLVLAINKMDLVGWSQERYEDIMADFALFAARLGDVDVTGIPMSAKNGDNVVLPGTAAPWFKGVPLLTHLEEVPTAVQPDASTFRLPVQWVNRAFDDVRGYAGRIAAGSVTVGDVVVVTPSGATARVHRILAPDQDADDAVAGQSVTLILDSQIDVSRGAVIAAPDAPPAAVDRVAVRLFWSGQQELRAGTSCLAKLGPLTVNARIIAVENRIDPDCADAHATDALGPHDIGDVVIAFDRPVAVDRYVDNRETGGLILIDRESAATLALGLIRDWDAS